jgi:hypothetical protein
MNKHRVIEIICVVFLICFILVISNDGGYSDKTVREVVKTVSAEVDMEELTSHKKNKVQQEFNIDFTGINSFAYYASESIMNVNELLIIKLEEGVKADGIIERIESRVKEKQILFESYAPEQSALLKNYQLTYVNGFVFYAVGSDNTNALIAFLEAVK